MNRDAVSSRLAGKFGRMLECHAELGSTNDRARELLALHGVSAHGAVVIADNQTDARGRLGRSWHSSGGKSLALSVALWPRDARKGVTCLPLAGALAVMKALAALGLGCKLKWPNDVLANGRKIAGILLEGRFNGDSLQGLVLGIGVNLGQGPKDFPPEIRETATSARIESGRDVEPELAASLVIESLEPLVALALSDPAALVTSAEGSWIHEQGGLLRVAAGEGAIEGRFFSISEDGELLLETGNGVEKVRAGEVTLLKLGG